MVVLLQTQKQILVFPTSTILSSLFRKRRVTKKWKTPNPRKMNDPENNILLHALPYTEVGLF